MTGSALEENLVLRGWGSLSLLNWIRGPTLCIPKTTSRKL